MNKILLIFILLVLDVLWIILNFKSYNQTTFNIQKTNIKLNFIGAIITYILIIFSVLYISIPLIESKLSKNDKDLLKYSILYGGGLGLSIYGIYNFTNVSVFSNYNYATAIKDTLWGTFIYTFINYIYFRY